VGLISSLVYDAGMAKPAPLLDVACPCCQAQLRVDSATGAVISSKEPEKPPVIEDLQEAVTRLKGESARRDEAFRKSFEQHRNQADVLSKKFDELLKQAKETPDDVPPVRPFDLD